MRRVLVVDDVDTNLMVAEGILQTYNLAVDTAVSGFDAVGLVESGIRYDIIFMDKQMPHMDGAETAQRLRRLGFGGPIVALTADVSAESVFDGCLPKPIETEKLDALLLKHLNVSRNPAPFTPDKNVLKRLHKIFAKDARKSIAAIRDAISHNDAKKFTAVTHAMKSALGNIGEQSLAELAEELELRGFNETKQKTFITGLEELTKRLENEIEIIDYSETENITDLLNKITAACEAYDDEAAYAALNKMQSSPHHEPLHNMLYLHTDFEGIINHIKPLLTPTASYHSPSPPRSPAQTS